jgi:1,5-anhydro-D-fructose reductase (1,5-anhydro-D-mannitol-forming)
MCSGLKSNAETAPGLCWGLIGASNVAREWVIDAIRSQPGNEVVTVLSSDADRAVNYAKDNNIASHSTDLNAVLSDPRVNAVYISTTNELHEAQTLAAAKAGKHVLCEKPLSLTLGGARNMVDACAKAGIVLATNHHLRNAATHRKIRELIRSGAIGTPLFVLVFHANYLPPRLQGWRINKPGGGVVLDSTIHDADTLRFILGTEPRSVTAVTQQANLASGELEDGVMAVLRFEDNVLVQIHGAYTLKYAINGIEIHGTEGSIVARGVMTQQPTGRVYLRNANGEEEIPIEHENLYMRALAAFNAAIRGEGQPSASGEDGVRSLAVALAVLESARTGKQVEIPS